jgi:hypothetical protein
MLASEAYTLISPLVLLLASHAERPRHAGVTDAEKLIAVGFFPCAFILLLAAVKLFLAGQRGNALSCGAFGIITLVFGCHFASIFFAPIA